MDVSLLSYLTLQPHHGLELQENATQSQPLVGSKGVVKGGDTHLGNVNPSFKVQQIRETFEVPPYGAIPLRPVCLLSLHCILYPGMVPYFLFHACKCVPHIPM